MYLVKLSDPGVNLCVFKHSRTITSESEARVEHPLK